MQLHTIQPKNPSHRARRVGRGGKRGTYSGRGMKGQKARGKNKIRPEIRDFIKRIPKLRGEEFPALPAGRRPVSLNLADLSVFSDGAAVTPKTLVAAGLLRSARQRAKLLGDGSAPKKLQIRGIMVSRTARQKIEAAGGTVNES